MKLKELVFRSLGYRLQNLSSWFKSLDIQRDFGKMMIRKGSSDIRVFKQIFLDEVYHFFPADFNPKVIVDAGANVGYSAVWFASKFPNSKIYAIEPVNSNFEVLVMNTKSHVNIKPIQAGLWNERLFLMISNPNADSWGFRTVILKENEGNAVPTVTMSQLISDEGIREIDLLKIDIEGAEYELFEKGTEGWLPKVNMIMIEIHDQMKPGCSELIDEKVKNHGFLKFISKELTIYIKK